MPKMKMVANGIRKVQATSSHQKPLLPITPTILKLNQIRALWSPKAHDNDTIMLWAASCLRFFGFFRMGEITTPSDTAYDQARHLSYADIAVDRVSSPTMLRCHLKQPKTDRFHQGIHIFVGRTDNQLCPVAAMMAYLAARGASPGPLFIFKDGQSSPGTGLWLKLDRQLELSD